MPTWLISLLKPLYTILVEKLYGLIKEKLDEFIKSQKDKKELKRIYDETKNDAVERSRRLRDFLNK